jgi:hypothetical protein
VNCTPDNGWAKLTEEAETAVEDDEGRTDVPFVAEVGKSEHDDSSEDVGRSDKALGGCHIEPHADVENDGQEVGDGIGAGGGEAKQAGEAPDFQVQGVAEVLPDVKSVTISN